MMSSPPQLQQPLGLSQYQNMLNESPVKPASFYFNNNHDNSIHQSNLNYQDENGFKGSQLDLDPEISHQFLYSSNDENHFTTVHDFVPPSQNDDSNSQFLQFPPKFEENGHNSNNNHNGTNDNNENNTNSFQVQIQLQQQHQQALVQAAQNSNQGPPHLHSFQHNPNPASRTTTTNTQANLYPPMEFVPNSHSHNSINHLTESTSTNTISSFESMPLLTSSLVSSSVSDNSIASPISFQNHSTVTPRRANRRPSFSVTPLPSIYQTPAQALSNSGANGGTGGSTTSPIALKNGVTPTSRRPRHRRTRSRLSLDANGAASIVTINPSISSNSIRSPAVNGLSASNTNGSFNMGNGTNPFYTPPVFLSPHQGSPATTPLATPSIKKEHSNSNFASISPSMLMNRGSLNEDKDGESDHGNNNNDSVFMAAADLTMKLASKLASQSSHDQKFLCDPLNTEFTGLQIPQNDHDHEHEHITKPPAATFQKPNISRSQSSINLASIASNHGSSSSTTFLEKPHTTTNPNDPYQVKHYDILQPRKKIQKSNSTTNLDDTSSTGKKPKKVHSCPLCAAVFQRPEHVKRHMRSHSSEKPYECDEPGCGKRFNRGDNLKAHLRKIHHRQI